MCSKKKTGFKLIAVFLMLICVFANAGVSSHAAEIGDLTQEKLVAAWHFDEESGNIVHDATGKYDGTCNGTTIVDTPYGKGRSFNGVDDSISFNDSVIPLGKKIIRFKVKIDSQNISDFMTILSNSVNDQVHPESNCYGSSIGVFSDGKLSWYIYNGGSSNHNFTINSESIINDSKWHDVLLTWDGTTDPDGVKMYIDDMSKPHKTTTATSLETHDSSVNLTIGKTSHTSTYKYPFKGYLSQIVIYNEYSNPISASTNLNATSGDAKIDLSWGSVDGVEGYDILRSTTSGGPYTTVAEAVYDTYVDNDVVNGTTYYYVVRAVQNSAISVHSNEASATPTQGETSGNKALLVITMTNNKINEYDLTMSEVNSFISWYDKRSDGNGNEYYTITKDFNKGPFKSRKDYIAFDKISQFEVLEY